MFINDLDNLTDIKDTFVIERKNFRNTNHYYDFMETIHYFIDDFIQHNIQLYKKYDFNDIIYQHIYQQIIDTYENIIDEYDINIDELINETLDNYFILNNNFRQYNPSIIINNNIDVNMISKKLDIIKNKFQPEQKSDEWYKYRYEGLTASNLWKAIDTQSSINNLILSKCEPLNINKFKSVNIDTPFHHGHKYEPLSIMIYEDRYNTKVGEYGCIQHTDYEFLKASPDGINIDETNLRYGRLVEVKNPTSRKITGTPKLEYWIQMQHQMEVCDLDECDFLETSFKEYENEEEFNNDGDSFTETSSGNMKGIMIMFDGGHYEYPPLNLNKKEFEQWYDKLMDNTDKMWIKNIYWRLEDYSNVLVVRNHKWYASVLPSFIKTWNIILQERKTGYEHRRPNKRGKKVKKINNKSETDIKNLFPNLPDSPKMNNGNIIIKVRTTSFENS